MSRHTGEVFATSDFSADHVPLRLPSVPVKNPLLRIRELEKMLLSSALIIFGFTFFSGHAGSCWVMLPRSPRQVKLGLYHVPLTLPSVPVKNPLLRIRELEKTCLSSGLFIFQPLLFLGHAADAAATTETGSVPRSPHTPLCTC